MELLTLLAQVNADPDASGMPGVQFIETIISWVAQIALWGSLLSVLVGASLWGLSNLGGNPYGAGLGQKVAFGGAVGAAVAALADSIINALFNAAGGVPPAPPV